MSKRIPLDQALATARANEFGRMLNRSRDNRLEPECWPHVKPSFQFSKDQKFFAIGSCFAENIGKRLVLDGYNVLGATVKDGERRNRYTPPAIYQELAWASSIYHRDDKVRDEDVAPLLLEIGKDKWTDLWSRPELGALTTREATIEKRKGLYSYFRGAFEADVVIITLGLIEAWWDEVSGSYVEFDTPWTRRPDRERFQFEKLSFDKCKDYIQRTLELVLDGRRRVLLTTSPVILSRTFTDKDIIIANSHSKSVLRAVAGELSDQFENVDYFPSYEIATLTRRPEVWENDLIHIQPNFIARIMQHVTNAYVPGSIGVDERVFMQMANLVDAFQFDQARRIYHEGGEAIWDVTQPAVHVAAMQLALKDGDRELALRHALRVDDCSDLLYQNHPNWMFDISRVFAASPEYKQRGEVVAKRAAEACAERPDVFLHIFNERQRAGDEEALRDLIPLIVEADVNHPMLMHKVCAKVHEFGRTGEALELAERQLARTPDHGLMLARRARLLLALDRPGEAAQPLQRLAELEPENAWAHLTLARTYTKVDKAADALRVVETYLGRAPSDGHALALKARLLWKTGRKQEAAEAARRALVELPEDRQVAQDAQVILRELAA